MSVRMFGAGHKGRTARLGWLVQRGDGLKGLRNAERGVNAKFGEAAKSVCECVCVWWWWGGLVYEDSHLQLILQHVCVFVHQWHHKLQSVCVCWQAVCAHPSMCQV